MRKQQFAIERPSILFVDDERLVLSGLDRQLSRLAVTQAGTRSPALAHRGCHALNQIEAPPCRHQSTPPSSYPKLRSSIPHRTLEWMQPAPAYPGGGWW